MKRYPHTAIITIEAGGGMVKGEYQKGTTETIEVQGRYETGDNKGEIIRNNKDGKEVKIKAMFYTKHKNVEGAVKLSITGICNDIAVVMWEDFQSHSVINL